MITEEQRKAMELVEQYGSVDLAARHSGMHREEFRGLIRSARMAGNSPAFTRFEKPEGMTADKASVFFNCDGTPTLRWLKFTRDQDEKNRELERAIAAMEKRAHASAPVLHKPKAARSDILAELPIADHHFRKLAWKPETGADWDLAIASTALSRGIDSLLSSLDCPGKAVLVNLGDYAHSNNREGTTDRSGHVLDTDSRWDKALDCMISAMCSAIEKVAQWSQSVEVINIPGNHDDLTCKWLQRVMSAYYHKCPHIKVRVSPLNREFVEHGNCLLGWYHGDKMSTEKMAHVVAAEQAHAWGRTIYRSMHCGHLHSKKGKTLGAFQAGVQEVPGLVVEHLQSLCANDAWHAESGYIGQTRAIEAFEWHHQHGPWNRVTRTYSAIMEGVE